MERADLSLVEEFDIRNNLINPHLMYHPINSATKSRVAASVSSRDPESVILISPAGFESPSVFAGMTEKQIEYIAQNAPREYKEAILNLLEDGFMLEDAFEIAKGLDEGNGSGANRERFMNVVQYLKNNKAAFKF